MKVLDLQCRQAHGFEGWFGSEEDFLSQRERGLVTCPVCGDAEVSKLPSAPRLNLRSHEASKSSENPSSEHNAPSTSTPAVLAPQPSAEVAQLQAAMWQAVKHVLAHTEDVGTGFAEEARKIHYGEAKERHIRGQASLEETQSLIEEGIEVMPLPLPESLKGPLQ
jgi:hypothetical protein